MRLEHEANPLFNHFVDVAGDYAQVFEAREEGPLAQDLHLGPAHAGSELTRYGPMDLEHDVVQRLLFLGELAADGPGGGDVAGVLVELVALVGQD